MKTWIYSWIVYPILFSLAMILGLFNDKINKTLRLRFWKDFLSLRFNVGRPIEYWIHVASQGELEYAIPIIESLNKANKQVLVTYYSVSAKASVDLLPQRFSNVSLVVPIPHDGLGLMKGFVRLLKTQGVQNLLLMKYELWPGLLWECNSNQIRVFLVNALKPSWFHKRLLHKLTAILSGYETEISSLSHPLVKVVGDTRVERVIQRTHRTNLDIQSFFSPMAFEKKNTLILGSMWPSDSEMFFSSAKNILTSETFANIFYVAHEINEKEREDVERKFKELQFEVRTLSSLTTPPVFSNSKKRAVIINFKGILAELYKLGKFAYVGGGFGKNVHSVWEPALCECFVSCGPKINRSPEASELFKLGYLDVFKEQKDFEHWLRVKVWNSSYEANSKLLHDPIVKKHIGSGDRIVQFCESLNLKGDF